MQAEEARNFCLHIAKRKLTPQRREDLDHIVVHGAAPQRRTEEQQQRHQEDEEEAAHREYQTLLESREAERERRIYRLDGLEPLTLEDRRREVITINYRSPGFSGTLHAMTENHVYVTYFMNRHTQERILFNLALLARQTLTYGVEFSQNKFAKVTWRFLHGPSVLLFASGAMVMTGAHGSAIRQKVLEECMEILRRDCHYENLVIERNTIENIVIKGVLSFGLCLNLLSDLNPKAVRYNPENFSGAIISVKKLHRPEQRRRADDTRCDSYEYCEEIAERDKDYISPVLHRKRKAEALEQSHEASSEQEEDEEKESRPRKKRRVERRRSGQRRMTINEAAGMIFDADTLDEEQLRRMAKKKKKNITFIAFDKGQLICAGGKSREESFKTCALEMDRFVACRNTLPENVRLERQLLEKKNKK